MSTYEAEGLRVSASPNHDGLKVCFYGRSDRRHPAAIMDPWFQDLLPLLANQRVQVDFCAFEYMNSSSIMPICQFLQSAATTATDLHVTYDNSKDWQRLSFSSLSALASGWKNFSIEAQ
jgi:hypothetical protein